jgi:tRNA-Thr(GGU) m(6)t(6)A37 methyltransferase TsaA
VQALQPEPIGPEAIGVVRSTLRERKNAPRSPADGAPEAVLDIEEKFAAALEGVTPGMELIAITWLHEAVRDVLQVHPRRDRARPLTGVFATRSPDRPNPIGLHRVTVTALEPPARIHVAALDAIDGTPILDLKIAR